MKHNFYIYILVALLSLTSTLIMSAQSTSSTKRQWAKYDRYEKNNAALTVAPDVVFMGNSITDNWASLVPEFFSENNYAGRGISGQTTEQMLARFRQDVVDLHPQIVVILAGVNDIAQNNGPISTQQILNNIKSMCDIARANNITPILCSILPCDYFSWRKTMNPAQTIIELNKMIFDYAKSMGYKFVDYYSALATEVGALNPQYTHDRCHPTVEGYKIMIPIVQNVLLPMLNK